MKEYFEINQLSYLHNGKNIFFCKTDYIYEDFDKISKIANDVIFITGNSDYPITDQIVKSAPKNIIKWYCQNAISNNDIIEPIPIGIENHIECFRNGHGVSYKRAGEKKRIISNLKNNIEPSKLIYANFNIQTNINYRTMVRNVIKNIDYIDWVEPNLNLVDFFNKLIEYKIVICPIGNGIDTHRLWETLYCQRVPLVFRFDYKIYRMYEELPIIILDSINDLYDKNLIIKKYHEVKNKSLNKCQLSYWLDRIKIYA